MKKLLCMYLIGNLTVGTIAHAATNTTPNWLKSKIINTTNNVKALITINYIPDCSKITFTKEKNECIAQGGSTLTFMLDPAKSKSIVLLDIINFVNVNKQCPQPQGTYENSIQVSFPTEPGTTTYSPITLSIAPEDLQKAKTFNIRLYANKMSFK